MPGYNALDALVIELAVRRASAMRAKDEILTAIERRGISVDESSPHREIRPLGAEARYEWPLRLRFPVAESHLDELRKELSEKESISFA
jgi:hypothetical protein